MSGSLLHLLHLVSPALPVGAYAYSQGLEWAVEAGWLDGPDGREEGLRRWLLGLLNHGLGTLDLPVLLRCIDAWETGDLNRVEYWNSFVAACRETAELQMEDQQLGLALQRLLVDLGLEAARPAGDPSPPAFAVMFALACSHWQVSRPDALRGFAWSWLENQMAAAIKLVPLGQTRAQRLLLQLMPEVEPVCVRAETLEDEMLGQSLPGLAIASSLHERQYTRLFRS